MALGLNQKNNLAEVDPNTALDYLLSPIKGDDLLAFQGFTPVAKTDLLSIIRLQSSLQKQINKIQQILDSATIGKLTITGGLTAQSFRVNNIPLRSNNLQPWQNLGPSLLANAAVTIDQVKCQKIDVVDPLTTVTRENLNSGYRIVVENGAGLRSYIVRLRG